MKNHQYFNQNPSSHSSASPVIHLLQYQGSATWPEEKLRASNQRSLLCKSEYRFLKTSCQNLSRSRAWGLVIVTASRDGRIQSFHNYDLPVPV
ncbi:hypothetical protein LIER_12359 [Lithospermum erythrorhizon]|uniref:Uncharacterized protein n=1 Tax=Lithospermum erythrorhizon TaxID=34254 RepID=A0AAV3PS51_LITER